MFTLLVNGKTHFKHTNLVPGLGSPSLFSFVCFSFFLFGAREGLTYTKQQTYTKVETK